MRLLRSRSPGLSRANFAKLQAQIRESHDTSPDADVLRSVSFPSYSQIGGAVDLVKAEQALAELPGYVPGTFRFDAQGRTVSFQYHGAEDMAPRYGLFLAAKAMIMMSFTPTFGDGAFLLKENSVATNRPAGGSSTATATPPVPATSIAEVVANELKRSHRATAPLGSEDRRTSRGRGCIPAPDSLSWATIV